MITIGQRVQYAIEAVERGEFEHALEHVSIAIDITAKKYYQAPKSTNANYKNLLKEYSWLIEIMSLGGINLDESKFGNYPVVTAYGKEITEPTFQDFLYHIVRCGLSYDESSSANFSFIEGNSIILSGNTIALPKKLIWGLLAVIVFCPINAMQRTSDGYWLSLFEHKFVINEAWGKEDLIRRIYDERNLTSVILNIPHNHFNGYKLA